MKGTCGVLFNPFSAMGNLSHHIIVNLKIFEGERVNLSFDILGEMQ